MERADFVHLARLSEQASAEDAAGYRRSVAAFAALGYGWVVACFVLACAALWWIAMSALQGKVRGFHVGGALAAAGLLWTTARDLWCRLEPPQGLKLSPKDAPALFEAIERIRAKVKGPPVHGVYIDGELNAAITQRPRYGLFGGATNDLVIGLPLLMALDRPRFLAVLAHEYGHLRGDHGRFAAWIYRTRLSWARLDEGLQGDEGPIAAATQAFLRWYFPRFVARTFALARQDEYEADRIAGRLLGREAAGAALIEVAVKADWLDEVFWPDHWALAATEPLPQGPYRALRSLAALAPPEDLAARSLRAALRRISDVDDTHPVLRDRLDALDAPRTVSAWSTRGALELLGPAAAKCIAHFDKAWCADNATAWKQHHARLQRARGRRDALQAQGHRTPAETVELAGLQRRLDRRADVAPLYMAALQESPQHGGALRGLVDVAGPADPQRLARLELLHEHSPPDRWWAARTAVATIEEDAGFDKALLQRWRDRLKSAEQGEERAWEQLRDSPHFESVSRHDLTPFELQEAQAELALCEPVARAWLVRKQLTQFPWRRAYLLFLDLPAMDDEERWHLCRAIERWSLVPGPVLVVWAGTSPTLRDIERHAGAAIYTR